MFLLNVPDKVAGAGVPVAGHAMYAYNDSTGQYAARVLWDPHLGFVCNKLLCEGHKESLKSGFVGLFDRSQHQVHDRRHCEFLTKYD